MKKFNPLQLMIIQKLQDYHSHSGSALGSELGVSRTSIWKNIKQFIDLGLPIQSTNQKGYQLEKGFRILDEVEIKNQLEQNQFNLPYRLHIFQSIDSTNQYLKALEATSQIEICCSEEQTQGRGRFNRNWYSPFGENIYCSIRFQIDSDLSKLSGLSLIVSLAIIKSLEKYNLSQDLKIKWPNDILWRNRKLCGNLIEILAESNAQAMIVIGVGLNVNSKLTDNKNINKPSSSLYEIHQTYYNRNLLLADLISELSKYLKEFLITGLETFQNQWEKYDYLLNKYITVHQPNKTITGIAQGVTKSGELILKDEYQHTHYLSSGDTSMSEKR